MRDMPILEAPKFEVPIEGTKEPRAVGSQLKVPRKGRDGVCGQAHHRMLHGSNVAPNLG